jgi:hypothetical protein
MVNGEVLTIGFSKKSYDDKLVEVMAKTIVNVTMNENHDLHHVIIMSRVLKHVSQ